MINLQIVPRPRGLSLTIALSPGKEFAILFIGLLFFYFLFLFCWTDSDLIQSLYVIYTSLQLTFVSWVPSRPLTCLCCRVMVAMLSKGFLTTWTNFTWAPDAFSKRWTASTPFSEVIAPAVKAPDLSPIICWWKNTFKRLFYAERPLHLLALAVNKSPAVFIFIRALDDLLRENRGSVTRLGHFAFFVCIPISTYKADRIVFLCVLASQYSNFLIGKSIKQYRSHGMIHKKEKWHCFTSMYVSNAPCHWFGT